MGAGRKKRKGQNLQEGKEGQKKICGTIDDELGIGLSLSPEYQTVIYNNEENYSKIVKNYTRYTTAVVWMNFAFKLVYFVGSCALLWIVTKLLTEVIYSSMKPLKWANFLQILSGTRGVEVIDSSKIEMLLTALTAFITSVIVIPLTITKYLFNQKEVEQYTALLQGVQQHNENMLRIETEKRKGHDKKGMLSESQQNDGSTPSPEVLKDDYRESSHAPQQNENVVP